MVTEPAAVVTEPAAVVTEPAAVAPVWPGPPPAAAVVDLDDTLYPQAAYLAGAVRAVAARASALGLDGRAVHEQLALALSRGSDKGGTIDQALAGIGLGVDEAAAVLPALVAAFVGFAPARLSCYPGAEAALVALAAQLPVVCLTDGDPRIQRAKLCALRLGDEFRAVVFTDDLGGRAMRKPNPAGLLRAAELLDVAPASLIMIGDRPAKDVAVAAACGTRAIRIRQGEYSTSPDVPVPWASVTDFPAAVRVTLALLGLAAQPRAG